MFDVEPGPWGFSSSNNEFNASCTFTALMCLVCVLKLYMQRFDTFILFVHLITGTFRKSTYIISRSPRPPRSKPSFNFSMLPTYMSYNLNSLKGII